MPDIRTLLLTDVVDSTRLTETLGDAAAAELGAAHDRVARDLLRRWRGREIDKTDGMLMLFDDVADAVGCALAYHAALDALPVPLQARAGIHLGPVTLRANPPDDVVQGAKPLEVEGLAKPLAARIMSLAQGGQTLLSAQARAALGDGAYPVRSHGHWRIKGLADPVELFEAGRADAPFVPPPDNEKVYRVVRHGELWLPRRDVRHSLPAERDAFVGRRDALRDLARRFERGARLVSVLGIGGSGKTRLAVHFAWSWLGDFPGGAWFCDLAQARDIDGVALAVAQGLDVPLGADDPVAQLGRAIAGRGPCLLVVDNFEQVLRFAAQTVGQWLDRVPMARFLVTTREVLGLPSEEVFALAPMDPVEAQDLFTRRAAAAAGDMRAGEADATAIPQLVRLLDGLPLAIELAAARARALSPKALLARMDQRFKLLAAGGGRRDRQATLRAAFDWSWDLLNDAEKALLAQLSVFEGGFTAEAAETVVDLPTVVEDGEVLVVLMSLVDKSLVRRAGGARYDLLGSVQDYAGQRLRGDGATGAAVRRHCGYYAGVAAADPLAAIGDIDNLVAACRHCTTLGDSALTSEALEGAWSVLELRGPFRLGVDLSEGVLPLVAGGEHEARVRSIAGIAALTCGQRAQAKAHFEAVIALARSPEDDVARARAESLLGSLLVDDGRIDEARSWQDIAWRRAESVGDDELLCRVCAEIGHRLIRQGAIVEALDHFGRALHVARRSRRLRWEGGFLGNLGYLTEELGRAAEAETYYADALAIARRIGDLKFTGNILSNLGLLEQLGGRTESARLRYDEALSIASTIGHRSLEAVVLCNLGLHHDDRGEGDRALRCLNGALDICREMTDPLSEGQCLGYLGLVHAKLGDVPRARACLSEGERLLRALADPVSLAVLLCAAAEVEHLAGARAQVVQRLDEARALASSAGSGAGSELGRALERVRRLAA